MNWGSSSWVLRLVFDPDYCLEKTILALKIHGSNTSMVDLFKNTNVQMSYLQKYKLVICKNATEFKNTNVKHFVEVT